jgi:hypothetical protein
MRIIPAKNNGQTTLPSDFVSFLSEYPAGSTFSLWNLQGALRFTRHDHPPNWQTFEPELTAAQRLGLIEPAGEDVKWTEREWQSGYPPEIRAGGGIQYRRTARTALDALSTNDLKQVIDGLESELANALAERDDFAKAHPHQRSVHPETYRRLMNEFREPVRELRAKVRQARAILQAKEAAAN